MYGPLRIGTRGSKLALWQARRVEEQLKTRYGSKLSIELQIIKTSGDKDQQKPFINFKGKGVFIKELDRAVLDGRVHCAVHSLKDCRTTLEEGLELGAVLERDWQEDVLVAEQPVTIRDLPKESRIGTGSLRRRSQILSLRSDLEVVPIRGNIETRLKKLKTELLDALVMAAAGLHRMGYENYIRYTFPVEEMVPAVGQGVIGVVVRKYDEEVISLLERVNHVETHAAISAERECLRTLGGGCQVPIGVHAVCSSGRITVTGRIIGLDGSEKVEKTLKGKIEEAENIGRRLAVHMKMAGGDELLAKIRRLMLVEGSNIWKI